MISLLNGHMNLSIIFILEVLVKFGTAKTTTCLVSTTVYSSEKRAHHVSTWLMFSMSPLNHDKMTVFLTSKIRGLLFISSERFEDKVVFFK